MSRVVPLTAGQLPLFEMPVKRRSRKARYRHVHTKEELAAFDRTLAVVARIRGGLEDDERWCPGGCGKIIRRERRSCGRRWCDAVRPSWAASFRSVIHSALDAYCELYGSEAKLLQGVLTCTAEPWWWDRSKCSHGPDVPCSGPRGCRVLESVAEEQRLLACELRDVVAQTERVFYVAPWLSGLSGVTMTVARLSRRVWGARFGLLRHAEDDRGAGAARRAAARLGGRGSKRTLSVRPSALQSCVLPLRGMRGDVITQGRVRSHCDMRRCAEAPSPRQSETVSIP